ncbi:hypothetical protein JB92DRAFT_1646419 [Gautieria morchelliformis]|nr:hypothetical protein JB92DRAFT_1646419 [Gautieria morchelliformis]
MSTFSSRLPSAVRHCLTRRDFEKQHRRAIIGVFRRTVTIKFMISTSRMGSVVGKQRTKNQDASGARLNANEGILPEATRLFRTLTPIHTNHYTHNPLQLRKRSVYVLNALVGCTRRLHHRQMWQQDQRNQAYEH